jgi:hypothetical protein
MAIGHRQVRVSRKVDPMKRPVTVFGLLVSLTLGSAGSLILSSHAAGARSASLSLTQQSAAATVARILRYSADTFTFRAGAHAHSGLRHGARSGVRGARGTTRYSSATMRTSYAAHTHRYGTSAARYSATGTARGCPHIGSSTSTSGYTTSTSTASTSTTGK